MQINSDGFLDGIPGICSECFSEQKTSPHPKHYYCRHRERLAVQREGGWETFSDVSSEITEYEAPMK
jgi:hypothetical protein